MAVSQDGEMIILVAVLLIIVIISFTQVILLWFCDFAQSLREREVIFCTLDFL